MTEQAPAIIVDTLSGVLSARASTRWLELRAAAARDGLTFDFVVDAFDDETIGDTLAAPEVLPPLWPAHTVRAALVSIAATPSAGERYHTVKAPRTASGPDLRSLFLGSKGANGTFSAVSIRAERAAESVWMAHASEPLANGLQSVLNRFGSVVTVHAGAVTRVRISHRIGRLAAEELSAAGFVEVDRPKCRAPKGPMVALPFPDALAVLADKVTGVTLRIVAAGPTHVAIEARPRRILSQHQADEWVVRACAEASGPARVSRHPRRSPTTTPSTFGRLAPTAAELGHE